MRTTVDLPDAVLKRARAIARKRQIPVRELIEEGLRLVIERYGKPTEYRLEDCSFGEGGLVEGLEPDNWDAIRDRAYEGHGS